MSDNVGFVTMGDEPQRSACAAALEKLLADVPDGDGRGIALGGQVRAAFGSCDANGQRAILGMLPAVLAKTGSTHAAQCREVVASALKMADPAARVLAIRLAIHPEVRMRPDAVPLLNAPEPEVRPARPGPRTTSAPRWPRPSRVPGPLAVAVRRPPVARRPQGLGCW